MKFKSLNRRYLWWAVLSFGLVLTLLCTLLVLYDSSRLDAALRQKQENVVGLAQVSLTSAVWNLDEEVVKEIVKAIALDDSIVFIHVVSAETTLFRYLRPDYMDRQEASIGDSSKVIRKTADILRTNSKIGSIEVGISTAGTRRQLLTDTVALVSIAVLTIAAIILTIYRVVERKRHEQALQEAYDVIKDQKERMENELNVGREIQMSMVPLTFPAFPDRDEFSVYAKLKPARELGGDFYDFYFVDERRFFFCIGDVSGKGVPAALFMAVTKTLIKSRTAEDWSTASILTHINDELSKDNSSCMFVTLFAGILDVTAGEFIYTNAGHNPPYLRRKDGSLERLDQRHGPAAGAMPGMVYGEAHAFLAPGDLLLLYTDGVTEAMNIKKELFPEERLVEILRDGGPASTYAFVDKTVAAVEMFEQGAEQADDVTVLALQFLATASDQTGLADKFTVGSHISEMSVIKGKVDAFAARSMLPAATTSKLKIVLDELISNIINYGYADDAEHKIEICLELVGHRLVVTIADDGVPFNPLTVKPPDTSAKLSEREIGGLGIHLVRNLVDEISYRRRIDKNTISFVMLTQANTKKAGE